MTIVTVVIGAIHTVIIGFFKGLEDLDIRGQVETIQTIILLRTVRIESRVLGS